MDSKFHYSPAEYHEQVAHIAERVVSSGGAILTFAPRVAFESNSYHAAAIKEAEQDRLNKQDPRLYR